MFLGNLLHQSILQSYLSKDASDKVCGQSSASGDYWRRLPRPRSIKARQAGHYKIAMQV